MAVKCGCRGIQVIMFLNLITIVDNIPFLFHLETTIPKMCRIEGCSIKECIYVRFTLNKNYHHSVLRNYQKD